MSSLFDLGAAALQNLRQLAHDNKLPVWSNDYSTITLGSSTYPRGLLTPFRRGDDEYYSLDSLCFLIDAESQSLLMYKYIAEAVKMKVQHVPPTNRSAIAKYLLMESEESEFYDPDGLEKKLNAASGVTDQSDGSTAAKRQRRDGSSAFGLLDEAADKPLVEWKVEDVVRGEMRLQTQLSILQCRNKNFTPVIDIYSKAIGIDKSSSSSSQDSRHKSSSRSSSSSSSSHPRPSPPPTLSSKDPNFGVPIIVVPAAVSSNISMYNVKQFLVNGVFESGERVRKENSGPKLSSCEITRSSHYDATKTVRYQIIDDIKLLKKEEDLNRIVGVFVSGPSWQFSDWPKSKWPNPAAIFESVCAFHLHFDDEPLHQNILQWRTHRLAISKHKRHGDRGVVLDFWHILTEFIATRNTTKKLLI